MTMSADTIQNALQCVAQFRQQHASDLPLAKAVVQVKRFQARRFQATYADLLHDPRYSGAARFFLEELYSERDYTSRDQQFARIASTIARLFPKSVLDTAAALAEVHALTETLDHRMGQIWCADALAQPQASEAARYVHCWRQSGDRAAREKQLRIVLQLGQQLDHLTHARGLRSLLKMMRRPASAAGLDALQQFLETGFDAFAQMGSAQTFLARVQQRESEWIRCLFDDDAVSCATQLNHLMAANVVQ